MVLLQKETCNLRHLIHLCHPVCIERMQVHTFACTHSRICSRAHTQAQQQIHESAHTKKSCAPTIHERPLFINRGTCKFPMTKKSCAPTIEKRPLFINSGTCKFPMRKKMLEAHDTIHKFKRAYTQRNHARPQFISAHYS